LHSFLLQGGTESIILAIKAHRDYYRDTWNIQHPEMVVGISAHAAVDKACDMLGIKVPIYEGYTYLLFLKSILIFFFLDMVSPTAVYKLIKVELDPVSFKVDLKALKKAITVNTIM
jgi:glutamate/tyrosine decarboxylase-like PLP-dependent enzyme